MAGPVPAAWFKQWVQLHRLCRGLCDSLHRPSYRCACRGARSACRDPVGGGGPAPAGTQSGPVFGSSPAVTGVSERTLASRSCRESLSFFGPRGPASSDRVARLLRTAWPGFFGPRGPASSDRVARLLRTAWPGFFGPRGPASSDRVARRRARRCHGGWCAIRRGKAPTAAGLPPHSDLEDLRIPCGRPHRVRWRARADLRGEIREIRFPIAIEHRPAARVRHQIASGTPSHLRRVGYASPSLIRACEREVIWCNCRSTPVLQFCDSCGRIAANGHRHPLDFLSTRVIFPFNPDRASPPVSDGRLCRQSFVGPRPWNGLRASGFGKAGRLPPRPVSRAARGPAVNHRGTSLWHRFFVG